MKKCSYCSREISSQAIKCEHCGKLIDSPTGSEGLWNRYWGYIISIPIIIVCAISMASSISNLTKSEELVAQDSNPLIAEQIISRPTDVNYQIARQSTTSSAMDSRSTSSSQFATKTKEGKPSPNDKVHKTSSVTDKQKKIQNQERLHELQKRQLDSLYR